MISPHTCIGCGLFDYFLCYLCARSIDEYEGRYDEFLGAGIQEMYICFGYHEYIQKLLHLYKFKHNEYAGERLAQLFTRQVMKIQWDWCDIDYIIAMPLHRRRQAERGYNQVDILVQAILTIYPHIRVYNGVQRIKYTQHASRLSRMERQKILGEDIFQIENKKALMGKNVLTVDDVITTGVSFNALSKVVARGCPRVIYGLFLASGH